MPIWKRLRAQGLRSAAANRRLVIGAGADEIAARELVMTGAHLALAKSTRGRKPAPGRITGKAAFLDAIRRAEAKFAL